SDLPFEPLREGSSRKTVTPRVLRNDFGDGYSQRAADGLNYVPQVWDLKWILNGTDSDTLITFFETKGGHTAFNWTPPRGTAGKYVLLEWTETPIDTQANIITARITQEYDT
ncbi:MAG: phage tail protein, partial [Halobacteriota archaeon]|nr:phage tail protein [Halobacteriota archaeon]